MFNKCMYTTLTSSMEKKNSFKTTFTNECELMKENSRVKSVNTYLFCSHSTHWMQLRIDYTISNQKPSKTHILKSIFIYF